jgi:hypothetical protein
MPNREGNQPCYHEYPDFMSRYEAVMNALKVSASP